MAQWIFKISGSDADRLTRSYTPETGHTFRILKNAAGKWSLVSGEWLDPHDDSSLGQLAMRGGAVALESHVKGCVIRPWDATLFDNAPTQARWEVLLPKSRVRCRKAAFLRPGDVVEWKEHGVDLSISFTRGDEIGPKVEIKDELPQVEVSSSVIKQEPSLFGMDGARDHYPENETESEDDEDDLDTRPGGVPAGKSPELGFSGRGDDATSQPKTPSTPGGEPFSTARTAATVIHETPSVRRQRHYTQENTDVVDKNDSSIQPATAQSSGPAVVNDSMKTVLDKEVSYDEASASAAPVDEAHLSDAPVVKEPVDEAPIDTTPIDATPADDISAEEAPLDEGQDDAALDEDPEEEGPDEEGLVAEALYEAASHEEAAAPELPHKPAHGNQAIDVYTEDADPEAMDTTLARAEQVPSSTKEQAPTVEVRINTRKANTDTQDERDLPELGAVLSQSSAKSGTKRKAAEPPKDFEESTTAQSSTQGKKRKVEQASRESEEPPFMRSSASASDRKLRGSQPLESYTSSKKGTPGSTAVQSPRVSASQASLKEATHLDEYAGPKPHILFSNTDAVETNNLDKNGSNFLCVGPGELKTTAKLLMSLVHRKKIVTDSWVTDSHKAGYLLQTTDYLPPTLAATNFDVDRSTLFQGKNIYFTPAQKKAYGEGFKGMENIVKAAGADNVGSRSAKDIIKPGYEEVAIGLEAIAIGLEDGDNDVLALQGNNFTVYKKDLISSSILAGELQTDDPNLVIPRKDDAKKAGKPKSKTVTKKSAKPLKGHRILVTGKLDGLTRREVTQLIEDNGGISETKLEQGLDYVVVGSKPGPKKLEEIEELGLPTIDQAEFTRMISEPE